MFNEIDVDNCFPGGVPLTVEPEHTVLTVEAFVAASFFVSRGSMRIRTAIAKRYVGILLDAGVVLEREDILISPAYFEAFTSWSSDPGRQRMRLWTKAVDEGLTKA